MSAFIIFHKQNLEATVNTVKQLVGVGEVYGIDSVDDKGIPVDDGMYQMIHISGDHRFAEFAMRNQGYARVVKVIE